MGMFAGRMSGLAVLLFPERMNHCRHEPQHAARALEFHQRGPIGIEPVENFRVDGIRRLEPFLIIRIAAFRGEFLLLRAVKLHERLGGSVAGDVQLRVGDRLKQPPPDNLETFLGTRRPPGRFHAADGVASSAPARARPRSPPTSTSAISLPCGLTTPLSTGRDADNEQGVLRRLGRFAQASGQR